MRGAGAIREYSEPATRRGSDAASGSASSATWYSSPRARPWRPAALVHSSTFWMRYLTPELPPFRTFQSNCKSKERNDSFVRMSWKPSVRTSAFREPSSTVQQFAGKGLPVISSQPPLVLPSNSNRQPCCRSVSVKRFGSPAHTTPTAISAKHVAHVSLVLMLSVSRTSPARLCAWPPGCPDGCRTCDRPDTHAPRPASDRPSLAFGLPSAPSP